MDRLMGAGRVAQDLFRGVAPLTLLYCLTVENRLARDFVCVRLCVESGGRCGSGQGGSQKGIGTIAGAFVRSGCKWHFAQPVSFFFCLHALLTCFVSVRP